MRTLAVIYLSRLAFLSNETFNLNEENSHTI